MSRPTNWGPLGWGCDPIPGCPDTVERIAREYLQTADSIGTAATSLRQLQSNGRICSEAVTAVLKGADELACKIDKVKYRYDDAGQALQGYGPHLRHAQQQSVEALRQAEAAVQSVQRCRREGEAIRQEWRLNAGAGQGFDDSYRERAHAADLRAGQHAQSLESAKALLRQAIEERDDAATTAAGRIDCAVEASRVNDSVWDKVVDTWQKIEKALEPLWPILDAALLVLSVAALFIPGGAALTAVIWTARALRVISTVHTAYETAKSLFKGDWWGVGAGVLSLAGGKIAEKIGGGIVRKALPSAQTALQATGKPNVGQVLAGKMTAQPHTTIRIGDKTRYIFHEPPDVRKLRATAEIVGPHTATGRALTATVTEAGAIQAGLEYASGLPGQMLSMVRQPMPQRMECAA